MSATITISVQLMTWITARMCLERSERTSRSLSANSASNRLP